MRRDLVGDEQNSFSTHFKTTKNLANANPNRVPHGKAELR
jgi:hypothetical protein